MPDAARVWMARARRNEPGCRFDELMEKAASRAPSRMLVSIEDVGMATAFLATDLARRMTGDAVYIVGGYQRRQLLCP